MLLPIDSKYSSAVKKLSANPLRGSVCVTFTSGPTPYRFEGVSRRAILKALVLPPLSVGQWVNRHCLQNHRTLAPLY